MPKKRLRQNDGFPPGWQWHHGWLTYRVPKGHEHFWDNKKRFQLGKTVAEAYRTWAERFPDSVNVYSIGDLLDRYVLEVVSTDSPRTALNKRRHIDRLKRNFQHMPIGSFKPSHAYRYVYVERGRTVQGVKELKTLSHAYTCAVQMWGLLDAHPFKRELHLKDIGGEGSRYVEDWEIIEALSLPAKKWDAVEMCQAYIRVKLLTGFRMTDMLTLSPAKHFTEEGIDIRTSKTDKRMPIAWSDELRAAVELAKDARPVDISPLLFCKRDGTGYLQEDKTADGFAAIWRRFIDRVLAETKVKQRITERSLRCKAGSDEESLERARLLLGHSDPKVTERFYRLKTGWVKPASGRGWNK